MEKIYQLQNILVYLEFISSIFFINYYLYYRHSFQNEREDFYSGKAFIVTDLSPALI